MTHPVPGAPPGELPTGLWPTMSRTTSIGLVAPFCEQQGFPGTPHFGQIIEIGQRAAAVGVDALWFADHFALRSPAEGGYIGCWDAWTLMAGVAAAVPGMPIGPLVACTAYRNPAIIAKMSESIDDISGGRFILGLGAGWHKPEYDHFGIPFEPRVTRFDEAIQIIHPLLRQGRADVQGTYYQANEAPNLPRGPRPAGPPILIGSTGKRMVKLVARYADAWNTGWSDDPDEMRRRFTRIEDACREIGRDPKTVVRTVEANLALEGSSGERNGFRPGTVEEHAYFLDTLRRAGFRHIMCRLDPNTREAVDQLREILAGFDALAA